MSDQEAKAALFDGLVSAAKALGSGRRAELVDVLAQGERPVDQLATEVHQSVANTSRHLQVLLRAGLVRTRREGTRIFYSLADDRVAELWTLLREVAATQVAEIERLAVAYLGERDELRTVTRAELHRRLGRGVVVLDVRPSQEYQAGHIRGAISIPVAELPRRLPEVPPDAEVVAYCRGPYCVYADQAVRLLQERGQRVARLEDGYPEWARAGLPVERPGPPTPGSSAPTS